MQTYPGMIHFNPEEGHLYLLISKGRGGGELNSLKRGYLDSVALQVRLNDKVVGLTTWIQRKEMLVYCAFS